MGGGASGGTLFWMWMCMVINVKGLFLDQCVEDTEVYCLDWKATESSCRKPWSSRLPGPVTSVVCIVLLRFLDCWFTHHVANMHRTGHTSNQHWGLSVMVPALTRGADFLAFQFRWHWLIGYTSLTLPSLRKHQQAWLRFVWAYFPWLCCFQLRSTWTVFVSSKFFFLQGSAAHCRHWLSCPKLTPSGWQTHKMSVFVWRLLISRRSARDIVRVACLHLCSNDWAWTQL